MQLINLLTEEFEKEGHVVNRSRDDADTLIVSTALDLAIGGNAVRVIAADTDVLILLLYFWNDEMADIFMVSESTSHGKEQAKCTISNRSLSR